MFARIKSLLVEDEGLEMVEYALIVAVIALVALVGYSTLGTAVSTQANTVAAELS